MSLSERLELLVNLDPSQAVSAVRNFATETDRSVRTAESSLKRLSSTGLKLGAGGVGVGGFLTQIASGDIEAANQLQAAITQTGHTLDEYRSRIEETVAAQVKFGNTDEQVSNALATLTVSYNDAGKALDEMQLVADLAAKQHITLGEAATKVAAAHGGAGRIFKQFGIDVKANANGTKDYDGALTLLAQKLSGQAAAAADSWGGRLRALRAEVENQVSAFGQNYGPAILGVSAGLTAVSAITSGVASIMDKFRATTAATTIANEALAVSEAEVGGAAVGSAAQLAALDAAFASEGAAATAAGVSTAAFLSIATLGIGSVVALGFATGQFGDTLSVVDHEKLASFSSNLSTAFNNLQGATAVVDSLNQAVGADTGLAKAFNDAGFTTQQFADAIASGDVRILNTSKLTDLQKISLAALAQQTIDTATAQLDAATASGKLSQADEDAAIAATKNADGAENVVAALQLLISQNKIAPSALDSTTTSMDKQAAAAKKLEDAEKGRLDDARSLYDAEQNELSASRGVESALRSRENATRSVADAQKALNKALQGASADDLEKANLDISDAQYAAGDSATAAEVEEKKLDRMRSKGIATADEIAAQERKTGEARNRAERDAISVRDAEARLQDVRQKGTDQDAAVVSARQALEDARASERDAVDGVTQAYLRRADAQVGIKDAQSKLDDGVLTANEHLLNQFTILSALASTLDPNNPLTKNLSDFVTLLGNIQSGYPAGVTPESLAASLSQNGGQFLPSLDSGGYIPGRRGAPVLMIGHGGEYVSSLGEQASLAGGSSAPVVHLSQVLRPDVADDAERGVRRALILDRR